MGLLAIPWLGDFSGAAKPWGAAPEQVESPKRAKGREGNRCGHDGTLPTSSPQAALLALSMSLSLTNGHPWALKLNSAQG